MMMIPLSNNKEWVLQAFERWVGTGEGVFGILDENLGWTIAGSAPSGQTFHKMALEEAQGLHLADSWFWTRDADSRA